MARRMEEQRLAASFAGGQAGNDELGCGAVLDIRTGYRARHFACLQRCLAGEKA